MSAELLSSRPTGSDSTLVLTLSNPGARNALHPDMYAAGIEALESVERDPSIRAIVITGADNFFCAGGNLNRLLENRAKDPSVQAESIDLLGEWISALRLSSKPVIAAVDGAAALPIRARLGVPLIVTLHGYDVTSSEEFLRRSNEGRLYLRRRKQLWEGASLFLCISEFIRNKALQHGFPAQKLRLHYTGTDLNLFRFQAQTRDPNLILFVGRLVEKKGCTHLLDALAGIRAQHPAVRLAIIGTGPLESALRRRVATEGLPCEFLGMQPAHAVKDYMARARVFCVPSVAAANGDSEGLGMVFAEAQAMGTPVASFLHGGIPEVVRHGINGLLAPEGDSQALGENLLRLLRDDATWTKHSEAGRSWVHQRFDIVKQTAELEGIYAQVLADRP